jgi:predicted CoA-binding protein
MLTVKKAASEFLAKKRIAVTGVSRKLQGHGSNVVYQRLRDRGYEVFAINPNADEVEGDRCYHDLKSVPGRCRSCGDRYQAGDRGGHHAGVRRTRHQILP